MNTHQLPDGKWIAYTDDPENFGHQIVKIGHTEDGALMKLMDYFEGYTGPEPYRCTCA